MIASARNTAQTISHLSNRVNKITATLLQTPITGYSGRCPFLRGLSTISNFTSSSSSNSSNQSEQSYDSKTNSFSTSDTYAFNQNQFYHHQHHQQQSQQVHQNSQVNYDESSSDSDGQIENSTQSGGLTASRNEKLCAEVRKSDTSATIQTNAKEQPLIYNYNLKLRNLIKAKKDDESYRVFRKVRRFSAKFPHGTEQGRPVTIWCSNDYFGMSSHPKVHEAIVAALKKYGAGSGGTRNIAGNSPVHEQLEWELADLHEKEAALLFSSCYVANDSTLFTLLKLLPGCQIFSDAGNHASMIQGIRNSGAKKHIFRSFDAEDLENKLKQVPLSTPKIVAFETVHSMTGDISQVGRMCDIAHKYGAITFVDEVHAVGLYGMKGAGIAQRDNCMEKIDIVSGTLGKAYGNCGGYIASSNHLIDVVRSYASGFIFTTSLPPTVACGAAESVRILKGEEGRHLRELQQNNVFHMKRALTAAGLPHYHSKSHIIPIPVGNAAKCTQVSNDLLELGHYIQSINYPTVAKGSERLRVSVTPFHSEQMIDSLIEKIVTVWQRNDLDFLPPVELVGKCRRHQMMTERNTSVGHSLWCQLCHQEMDLCKRMPAMN